jgi:hypothetical protein
MRFRTHEDHHDHQGHNGEGYGGPEPPTEAAKEGIGGIRPTTRSRCRGGDHGSDHGPTEGVAELRGGAQDP